MITSESSSTPISLKASSSILEGTPQALSWSDDVSLSAKSANGSQSAAIQYGWGGFAIGEGRYDYQIDFDGASNSSEQLILDFKNAVQQSEIELGRMSAGEWEGLAETGKWTTYDSFGNFLEDG
ncbi:MAG: hypothetical protein ABG776_09805, partial [Cyanobacteria bacterium J06555_13]